MGAIIAASFLSPPFVLLTVFSRSRFAPLHPNLRGTYSITRTRKRENRRFANTIGAYPVDLRFRDAPLRFPLAPRPTLIKSGKIDHRILASLSARFRAILQEFPPSAIFLPVGYGGHIDHCTVRVAFETITPFPPYYYLDQPYAGILYANKMLLSHSPIIALEASPAVCRLKLRVARLYSSQPAATRTAHMVITAPSCAILESIWTTHLPLPESPPPSSRRCAARHSGEFEPNSIN